MAQEIGRFGGASEDDDEEELEMGVKDEEEDDDEDEEDEHKRIQSSQHRHHHHQQQQQINAMSSSRRCRPKEEKERTKLRERQRRAITARILAGLRRHGNYNLRVRADINDVIAALAREAGWVVLPDGTTFPSRSQGTRPTSASMSSTSQMMGTTPLASPRGVVSSPSGGVRTSDFRPCGLKSVFVPSSLPYDSTTSNVPSRVGAMAGDGGIGERLDNSPLISSCMDVVDDKQAMDISPKLLERDFAGTTYVPVYVMLPVSYATTLIYSPWLQLLLSFTYFAFYKYETEGSLIYFDFPWWQLGVINMKCELVDPDGLLQQLRILKSINVDGVTVDCWWGIVEAHAPQEYEWTGYKRLFQIVRELKLKLQVVMSFHECGGNVGDDVCIPLPHWVAEIGRNNPEIFFTDREGRRNSECLTWGIDKERVLRGRNAAEVYFDYMRSFRVEFDEFFQDGIISEIEVGLGPCGELRYPSYPVKHGWRYPGIGEFQCYDQYLMKSLSKAAEARGHSFWARGPDNAGSYNCRPHDTGFFCDGGDYDGYYGRFFLNWYSQTLIDHGDRVISLAKLAFEGTSIAAKLSGINWWYRTISHAAELTAGFYNPCNRDGYAGIATMLKKHGCALNFICADLRTINQHVDFSEASTDTEGLMWQVLNAAWDVRIPVASENAHPCHDREGYNKILENAKPMNDPDGRHLSAFTYLRLSPALMERRGFLEFERFVKRMHGEAVLDLQL
ncbi:hypothetical protein Syun_013150 [Stephania yunnanensis]|uniref:Beta-amylase n=1 Tax=Stephania yunnanensis TaxID=152371 RepID=A0AAP0K1S3_9MAGN